MTRHRSLTLIALGVSAAALAACGAVSSATSPSPSPTSAAPTATPTPVPTLVSTPTPATPTPTPQNPVLEVASCDGSDTASNDGGSVSYSGALADDQLIIEPGDVINPTGTSGTFGDTTPGVLAAGDYTYEFRDAQANHITRGSFTIVVCPEISRMDFNCADTGQSNGSVVITFVGALPDTLVLNPGDITENVDGNNPFTISGLAAGNYTITGDGVEGLQVPMGTC